MKNIILCILVLIYCAIWLIGLCALINAHAAEFTDEEIVKAIYLAEGGAKTRHPYGILTKYKTTTPRQACFNTVKNQRKRHAKHNCGKEFLACLRDRYCPLGASNDPQNLNRFWLKNVKFYLVRAK